MYGSLNFENTTISDMFLVRFLRPISVHLFRISFEPNLKTHLFRIYEYDQWNGARYELDCTTLAYRTLCDLF